MSFCQSNEGTWPGFVLNSKTHRLGNSEGARFFLAHPWKLKRCVWLALLLCTSSAIADIPPRIMDAIAWVETRNNDAAVGPNGERSRYQIREATWREYTRAPWPPKTRQQALRVAQAFLGDQLARFRRKWHREPTIKEVYACWNRPTWAMSGRWIKSKKTRTRCERFSQAVSQLK